MVDKKAPELRFKGFTDDWELCKLRGKVTIRSGWSPSNFVRTMSEDSELFIKVDDLNYSLREQKDSQMRVQDNPRFNKMKKGSTIFPKRGAAIMTNKVRILGSDGYMDTNMMALEPQEIDPNFLYTFIARTGLYKIADTSTIPQINNKHIEPYVIYCPNNEEQEKVGLLFKKLDDDITLHQRKLVQLKTLKQAYLQQLFPSDGEYVPKVRFANFNQDWEHRKLGNISDSFSGGTPSVQKSSYYGGDVPFIRSGEINKDSTELFITDEALNKSSAKMVNEGDILYALYGATSGEVGISKINGAINQAILAIKPHEEYDSYFVSQWLKKEKNSIIGTYLQGGQGNLSGNIIKKLILLLPVNATEQGNISMFFKKLDYAITLHQHKLESLNKLKQAYLQKMFI